jgi:hypothetical protein
MKNKRSTETATVSLSEGELAHLQAFAQAKGMTIEQAATHAISQALAARLVTSKRFNNVVRFPK